MEGTFESLSLSLIEKYFSLKENIIYYFPYKISSYLLIKNYHNNLKVFSIFIMVTIIQDFFKKILKKIIKIFLLKKKLNQHKAKKNASAGKYNFEDYFQRDRVPLYHKFSKSV